MTKSGQHTLYLIYDGECPLCQMGVSSYALDPQHGTLELVDARTQKDHPAYLAAKEAGLSIDEGMVLQVGEALYHGDDALNYLAQHGDKSDPLNALNSAMFSNKMVAKISYPFMKFGRNIALKMKGVGQIDE